MKEAAIWLGVALALILGILIGYASAVYNVHREAIANRAGHYEIVGERTEFAWGYPEDCR